MKHCVCGHFSNNWTVNKSIICIFAFLFLCKIDEITFSKCLPCQPGESFHDIFHHLPTTNRENIDQPRSTIPGGHQQSTAPSYKDVSPSRRNRYFYSCQYLCKKVSGLFAIPLPVLGGQTSP